MQAAHLPTKEKKEKKLKGLWLSVEAIEWLTQQKENRGLSYGDIVEHCIKTQIEMEKMPIT